MSGERDGVHDDDGTGTTLGEIVSDLWRRRWFILALATVGFVVAAGISLRIKPVYRASAVVAEAKNDQEGSLASVASQLGGLGALSAFGLGSSPSLDQTIAVLTSPAFVQSFIERRKVYAELFQDDWDTTRDTLTADGAEASGGLLSLAVDKQPASSSAGTPSGRTPFILWEGYRRFQQRLKVDRDPKTELVTVSVDASSPALAAELANAIVTDLNAELKQRAIQESAARMSFLQRTAERTSGVEMRAAVFRLFESEQKRALIANTSNEYALRVLSSAIAPDMRVKPWRSLIAIGGGMLAGAIAVIWVALAGTARRRMR